jgi:hypothetical protein
MKAMNEAPRQRKQGQAIKFGSVNRSALHMNRAKHTPISRTGQSTMGRVRAHAHHSKHI